MLIGGRCYYRIMTDIIPVMSAGHPRDRIPQAMWVSRKTHPARIRTAATTTTMMVVAVAAEDQRGVRGTLLQVPHNQATVTMVRRLYVCTFPPYWRPAPLNGRYRRVSAPGYGISIQGAAADYCCAHGKEQSPASVRRGIGVGRSRRFDFDVIANAGAYFQV